MALVLYSLVGNGFQLEQFLIPIVGIAKKRYIINGLECIVAGNDIYLSIYVRIGTGQD